MPRLKPMSRDDLLALFAEKTTAPPPGSQSAACEASPMQSLSPTRQRGISGPQRVPGQRPRSLAHAVSTAAAPNVMTLAPAWPQALPSLDEVPAHYSHEVNGELLYKLCAALTAKGLGSPETWVKCGRNCVAFARYSIMNAIGTERGELLQRNVEWRLEISDTLSDGHFTNESDPPVKQGKLCVTASCNGCGYLKIGRALDALEEEAPGLGSAFYWSLVQALYRVMRIYDHEDALMYEEQLREYIIEDEFPEVTKALPACIEQTLDAKEKIAGQRLLASHATGARMAHGYADCVL